MDAARASLPESVGAIRREIESLERRLRWLRREFEQDAPLPETIEILQCVSGDAHIGVPLANIERVVGIARLCPSNDAQPWLRGLLDIRGVMIPVVDVGMRIGKPARVVELGDLVVICTTHRARVGLWVASVLGVMEVQTATLDRNVPELMGAPYLLGVAVVNGHATYLLRNDGLLDVVDSPTEA
ncbi:MAG: chemotaxis protein CheW [Polyangiaceae bacterium]|nr:chemotaxis protein CheW [Polyangiaceae bacterium]